MTDLGLLHFRTWLRLHAIFVGLVLAVVFLVEVSAASEGSVWLWAALALDLAASLAATRLSARWGQAFTIRLLLYLDMLVAAVIVFYSGGIDDGLTVLYIPLILTAFLMAGRRAAVEFSVVSLGLVLVQLTLDWYGVQPYRGIPPVWVELAGQGVIVIVFVVLALFLTRASMSQTQQLQADKSAADRERAMAEWVQQRWALINTVALRVQESTTPQQVYRSIGEELERIQLHCVILEWAVPGETMRIAYSSVQATGLGVARAQFELDREGFAIHQTRGLMNQLKELRIAIAERKPVMVLDLVSAAEPLFSWMPRPARAQLFRALNAGRLVYAPMIVGERVSGVLVVFGESPDETDLAPFAALAQQAASALEKARLLTERQKRAAQLEVVSDIAAEVTSARHPDEIIQPLVRVVGERFGYQVVSVLLVDPTARELTVAASFATIGSPDTPKRQSLDTGILGRVARTGEVYLARDTQRDPYYHSPLPSDDPIRSELAIPLCSQAEVIGILDLESAECDAFDENDVTALTLLANQVAAALTRSRAFALEEKRAAHLALVGEIAARATTFSEPDAMLRTMVQLVQERFGYHHVCVSLYDPLKNEMEQRAAAGPNAHLYPMGNRWSAEEGLMGLAARTAQTVSSGDLNNDPRYAQDPGKRARSALCVPLLGGTQVLGVLDVESELPHAFDANDLAAMETLANQMAAALEKARSLLAERRRAAQLALVNRIASQTVRLMPADRLLRDAVEMIREQFGYYNVAVLVCEDESATVRLVANAGGLSEWITALDVPLTQGIIAYVGANGNTYLCTDPRRDPYYVSPFPPGVPDPVQSELAVPLRRGESVIGVLDIQSRDAGAFLPNDITALEVLADQLATALENARLLDALHARLRAGQILSEISAALLETTETARILELASEAARRVLDGATALVYLPDPEGRLVAHAQVSAEPTLPQMLGSAAAAGSTSARAFRRRAPAVWNASETQNAWDEASRAEAGAFRAGISVPMLMGERAVGVLTVNSYVERQFDAGDGQALSLLANQTAIALERAAAFQQEQERVRELKALYEASRHLSASLDVRAILENSVNSLCDVLGYSYVSIYFVEQGRLRLQVQRGYEQVLDDIPLDRGVMARALAQRSIIFLPDVSLEPSFLAALSDAQSEIAVPLLAGERVLGVLNVETTRREGAADAKRVLTQADVQLLSTFANQLVIAVENARLYEQTKRDAQVKAALLRELSHRVKNNLAAITSLLQMALDEPPEAREQILNETLGRVQSMSIAHALLAQSGEARVNLVELGRQVLRDTTRTLVPPGMQVEIEVHGDPILVAARQTTTLALVLNELATNALRHGLVAPLPVPSPILWCEVKRTGAEVWLDVRDNGNGLPVQLDPGLGLNLVRTLVEKDLHGRFTLERRDGWTCADVRFRLEEVVA